MQHLVTPFGDIVLEVEQRESGFAVSGHLPTIVTKNRIDCAVMVHAERGLEDKDWYTVYVTPYRAEKAGPYSTQALFEKNGVKYVRLNQQTTDATRKDIRDQIFPLFVEYLRQHDAEITHLTALMQKAEIERVIGLAHQSIQYLQATVDALDTTRINLIRDDVIGKEDRRFVEEMRSKIAHFNLIQFSLRTFNDRHGIANPDCLTKKES